MEIPSISKWLTAILAIIFLAVISILIYVASFDSLFATHVDSNLGSSGFEEQFSHIIDYEVVPQRLPICSPYGKTSIPRK